jgi:PAS domain S-box-containing protein
MSLAGVVAKIFKMPSSNRYRLILSLLFIVAATAVLMVIFHVATGIFDTTLTASDSQLYSTIFICITAPVITLFVLLRFENLNRIANMEIKERKRAEDALRESEEKLRCYYDQPLIGMALTSPEKGWIQANDEICRILGYSREELFERTWEEITYLDDLEKDTSYFDRLLAGEIENYRIEKRFVRKDGGIVPVEISIGCTRNPDKSVHYIVGLMRGITERKRAEDELRESERKFRAIFDQTLQFTGLLATDGILLEANRTALEFVGASESDVVGKLFWETPWWSYSPELRAQLRGAVAKAAAGEIVRLEAIFQANDGRLHYFDFSLKPVFDESGSVALLIPEGRDITERKRTEEDFKFIRFALDRFGDSALWLSSDGRLVYVNETACKSLGYTRDELLSMHVWDIDPDYPRERFSELWGETKCAPGPLKFETRHIARDGRVFPVEVTSSYTRYGEREYMITFDRDITERKLAEEELGAAKAQAELYLDLMGHDINNMHQIALGYLELARNMPPEPGQGEYLDKSIGVLQRSTQLIRNVRKLQKLTDNMPESHDVDVCQMLAEVQCEFGAVPGKTVTSRIDDCQHCHVRANELLHDVFANLVSNAIKHTGDTADIVIGMDIVDEQGQYCRVSVEDNGPGVPDDFKPTIFNRMLKGTSKAKGMGLGLYLVKSLVESYSGRVWVEDRVKGDHTKGARFVVMLPAVDS